MQVYLVTFASTHAALSFEGSFGTGGALVPVPPSLRAGCGMAWRYVAASDEEAARLAGAAAQTAGLAGTDWQLHAQAPDGGWRTVG